MWSNGNLVLTGKEQQKKQAKLSTAAHISTAGMSMVPFQPAPSPRLNPSPSFPPSFPPSVPPSLPSSLLPPTRPTFSSSPPPLQPDKTRKHGSMCPERKTCSLGSTSVDWSDCGAGYYCPAGTPSGTSYPCPSGSYSNRTDLAAASECYPCPLGFWCGGSGSDEPDGPCQAGYYCPLSTGSATDYPCPAGTFSNSTSLYRESQCLDCSPG